MSKSFISILSEGKELVEAKPSKLEKQKEENIAKQSEINKFTKYINVWFDFLKKLNSDQMPSRLPFRDRESDILFMINTYAKYPQLRSKWVSQFVNPLMKLFFDEKIPNQASLVSKIRNISSAENEKDADKLNDNATVVLGYAVLVMINKLNKLMADENMSSGNKNKAEKYIAELDSAFTSLMGMINQDKSRSLFMSLVNKTPDVKNSVNKDGSMKDIKNIISNPSSVKTKERFYKIKS